MKQFSILLAFLILTGCTASLPLSDDVASSEAVHVVPLTGGTEVSYGNLDGTELRGFIAVPTKSGAHPALVLIHEWWGLNDNIKDFARKFAAEGYVALAVDMYGGKVATTREEAQQYSAAVREDLDAAMGNLEQAVAYLRSRDDVNKQQLASVGWCFGGGWSYQMAKNDLGVNATVMYYGQFDPQDDFAHMRASIIGHFGENDQSIAIDTVNEFQTALRTAGGIHEVYIYPDAGHAFANESNPAAYNAEAAKIAWQRTLSFLQKAIPR